MAYEELVHGSPEHGLVVITPIRSGHRTRPLVGSPASDRVADQDNLHKGNTSRT